MESLITRKSRTCCRSQLDRKSTRLNSSHSQISYAVFCLKKKKKRYTARLHTSTRESALTTGTTGPQCRTETARGAWHLVSTVWTYDIVTSVYYEHVHSRD